MKGAHATSRSFGTNPAKKRHPHEPGTCGAAQGDPPEE